MLKAQQKEEVIKKFKAHEKDTGSPAVQVALLSAQIEKLSDHLKKNKKDFHSRRGLLKMVSARRSLMRYLEQHQKELYATVSKKLHLK